MIPDDEAYANLDRIDPTDPVMLAYWAKRWDVSAEAILAAIAKVGPLLKDVALEIWKLA
jgi:Zn-dependent peptidase ImmA (M78 family)